MAAVGITDMLVHNRNRRNEWLAQKKMESARELAEAKRDMAVGRASEDQILLVNRERVKMEAEDAKKRRPGVFKRVFGGGEAEEAGEKVRESVVEGGRAVLGATEEGVQVVEQRVKALGRSGEGVAETVRPIGGPLDREAELASRAVVNTGKSWTSWLTGRP